MKSSKQEDSTNITYKKNVILINNFEHQQFIQTPLKQNRDNVEFSTNNNRNVVNTQTEVIYDQVPINTYFPRADYSYELDLNPQYQMDLVMTSLLTINEQIGHLQIQMNTLQQKFEAIQNKAQQPLSDSRKKVRRKAEEIIKNYSCPQVSCGKTYGSDISLNLHLRLKHPSRARQSQVQRFKQKERQRLKKVALLTNVNTISVQEKQL